LIEEVKLRDKDIEELKAELRALREEVRSYLPPAE
jgi:ribosomal protein L29